MESSLETTIALSSIHCRNFRIVDYDLASLPRLKLLAIASAMLDGFEMEMEKLLGEMGSPGGGGAPSSGDGAPPARSLRSSRRYR